MERYRERERERERETDRQTDRQTDTMGVIEWKGIPQLKKVKRLRDRGEIERCVCV